MNKYEICLIALLISIVISIPCMFLSINTRYSYENEPCLNVSCPTDTPTGTEELGWPMPVCTRSIGGMPLPEGKNNTCELLSPNMALNYSFILVITFTIAVTVLLLIKKKIIHNPNQ